MNYVADNLNIKHITTDSGFDVDYGSSSSSSSWDYSSSYDDDRSSKDDDRDSRYNNYSYSSDSNSSSTSNYGTTGGSGIKRELSPEEKEKLERLDRIQRIIRYILSGLLLIVMFYVMYKIVKKYNKDTKSNVRRYNNYNRKEYMYSTDQRWPDDPNDRRLLEEAYNIFIGVQNAWMNFDYNKLRELVTDDLYNMYYNQLQTLSIKGEKNIMENFDLKDSYIYSKSFNKEKNITYYYIRIKVSFFDYIVDSNNNVVRGKKDILVNMEYELTFIKNESNIDKCPVCSAKIENGVTICPYCRSHLQGVSSKMKLSSKKGLRQW